MKRVKKIAVVASVLLVVAAVTVFAAFRLSPWPGALLIRRAFDAEAWRVSSALEKHLPTNVTAIRGVVYDPAHRDCRLDVFFPSAIANTDRALTTVVWVHGGGWISGSKNQIANYLKILTARGFTVVGVDYSIAPGAKYPTPVRQTAAALAHLQRHARDLHIDPQRLVLAGDSGGAQIVAQVALTITSPDYARALGVAPTVTPAQLAGLLLYCGPFDLRRLNLDGPFGSFMKTVLWAYTGRRDFTRDDQSGAPAKLMSVTPNVTATFPRTFISVGNGDPLAPQSYALAERLTELGVKVDRLFFPEDYTPRLPHEYQFNLETDTGRLALERAVAFLATL
jgi:acetyl esterase/lipase